MRTAGEIVRNLQMRIARLEKQAGISIDELLDLGIITEDQYMQAKQVEMGGAEGLPKVGDILVGYYNWNGTRSLFYKVLGVSKSFKTIKIVQLESSSSGFLGGTVTPIPSSTKGRTMTKKVTLEGGSYTIKVDKYVGEARIWDGTPQPYEVD